MTFEVIKFVSTNAADFQCLHNSINGHTKITILPDVKACFEQQSQNQNNVLILIDSRLVQSHQIAEVVEKISAKLLFIGGHWSEKDQIEAIAAGASGYCDSAISAKLFRRVLDSVYAGEVWVPRQLIPKVIALLLSKKLNWIGNQSNSVAFLEHQKKFSTLSKREEQVALLIAEGKVNKQIASTLLISERTVKAHLSNIFQKLEVPDRIHLMIFINNMVNKA